MRSNDLLEAIHAEHGGSASRMAATLVLAGMPLAEIEALKRGPWEGLAGRIVTARAALGVAPRQPVARYYLVGEKEPEFPRTPAEIRRLLLMGLEAGCPDDARDGHGEEAWP